jgi:hypothetical protein
MDAAYVLNVILLSRDVNYVLLWDAVVTSDVSSVKTAREKKK